MISVVLPVYNGEKFIEDAIRSVLAQSSEEWELVVVDDGSTDGTPAVLERFQTDARIKIIRQNNAGVSTARNVGMEHSAGEYIAFLDADDVWKENHLSILAELIDSYPGAGLYATFAETHLVNGNVIKECNYFKNRPKTVYIEDFLKEYDEDKSVKMFTSVSTCVNKAAALRVGGFPPGCKIGEDLELTLRLAAYYPFVLTRRVTAVYQKQNSTATKEVSFDPDWRFFDTVAELFDDESIPDVTKEHLRRIMQWFTMRRCRHYLVSGEKRKAYAAYKSIDRKCISRKDYVITSVLTVLPSWLVKKIFCVRWRTQA